MACFCGGAAAALRADSSALCYLRRGGRRIAGRSGRGATPWGMSACRRAPMRCWGEPENTRAGAMMTSTAPQKRLEEEEECAWKARPEKKQSKGA